MEMTYNEIDGDHSDREVIHIRVTQTIIHILFGSQNNSINDW